MISFFKNLKNQNKELIEYFFFFFVWLLIWTTIGSRLTDIYTFEFNISKSINWLRALISISFPIIIFLFLSLKLLKGRINFKSPFLIFLIYFLIQSSIFYTDEFNIIIKNIFLKDKIIQISQEYQYGFIFNGISVLLMAITSIIFFLIFEKEQNKLLKKILITVLIIYLIINFSYSLKLFYEYIKTNDIHLFYFTQQLKHGHFLLDNVAPRSTGISRSLVIFAILSIILLECYCINKYKKYLYLLIIFTNVLIFLLSSRFGSYSLIIFSFITIIYFNKNLKVNILKILIIVCIPYFISYYITDYKLHNYYKTHHKVLLLDTEYNEMKKNIPDLTIEEFTKKIIKEKNILEYDGMRGLFKKNNENKVNLSGRNVIWKASLEYFFNSNSKFFGFGSQADRRILYKMEHVYYYYSTNSSNGYIYALLSSGYIGLFFLLSFNFILFYKICFLFFIKKIYKKPKEYFIDFYFIILFFFLNLRMIVENSFSIFSIDFLIYLTVAFFIIHNANNYKLIKKKFYL